MKQVTFFCDHPIPKQHPNAIRLMAIAKIFQALDYRVSLISSYPPRADEQPEGVFEDVRYCYLPLDRFREYFQNTEIPDLHLVATGRNTALAALLSERQAKHRIKTIYSVCERYSILDLRHQGREMFRSYADHLRVLNHYAPKAGNVIAISKYFERYYREKNCNVIRIPTIVDAETYPSDQERPEDKLRLAYAGTPGKKDYVAHVVRALDLLSPEEREAVVFHIYGVSPDDLRQKLKLPEPLLRRLGGSLVAHGRIPCEEVPGVIKNADFTVLLRPDNRRSKAGFPTKVGESMACGVPVLANLTSDLDECIIDGQTGIVCRGAAPGACAEAIRRALRLSEGEKAAMRDKAKEMSLSYLHYGSYIDGFRSFLDRLKPYDGR